MLLDCLVKGVRILYVNALFQQLFKGCVGMVLFRKVTNKSNMNPE